MFPKIRFAEYRFGKGGLVCLIRVDEHLHKYPAEVPGLKDKAPLFGYLTCLVRKDKARNDGRRLDGIIGDGLFGPRFRRNEVGLRSFDTSDDRRNVIFLLFRGQAPQRYSFFFEGDALPLYSAQKRFLWHFRGRQVRFFDDQRFRCPHRLSFRNIF